MFLSALSHWWKQTNTRCFFCFLTKKTSQTKLQFIPPAVIMHVQTNITVIFMQKWCIHIVLITRILQHKYGMLSQFSRFSYSWRNKLSPVSYQQGFFCAVWEMSWIKNESGSVQVWRVYFNVCLSFSLAASQPCILEALRPRTLRPCSLRALNFVGLQPRSLTAL